MLFGAMIVLLFVIMLAIALVWYFCNKRRKNAPASDRNGLRVGRNSTANKVLTHIAQNKPVLHTERLSSYELKQLLFQEELNKFLKQWYPAMISWKARNENGVHLRDTFTLLITNADGKQASVNIKNTGNYQFAFFSQEDMPKSAEAKEPVTDSSHAEAVPSPGILPEENAVSDNAEAASEEETADSWLANHLDVLLAKRKELEQNDENILFVEQSFFPICIESIIPKLEEYNIFIEPDDNGYAINFM